MECASADAEGSSIIVVGEVTPGLGEFGHVEREAGEDLMEWLVNERVVFRSRVLLLRG